MDKKTDTSNKEEVISMFLGLAVVLAVVYLIFNFVQRRKGNISVPGVSQNIDISEKAEEKDSKENYVVKKGDSLWKIAKSVYGDGFKWIIISKENKLTNNSLEIGQKLAIPTLTESQKAETVVESPVEHVVVRGDNLWKIAVVSYNDGYKWTKIWDLNRKSIVDPNKLEIGMKLRLR